MATLATALLARPALSRAAAEAEARMPQVQTWLDSARKRQLVVRLRLPATEPPWPLIIYSPGLGSGVSNGAAWCDAWRDAGLMVLTIAHPQSSDDIWHVRRGNLRARLNVALQWTQFVHRINDCRFVIDQCTQRGDLRRLVDARRIGAAGHSYGALTVQALAGQWYDGKPQFRDARIRAATALSPGANPIDAARSAAGITIPTLCVTGDQDGYVTFGNGDDAMRLGVPLDNRLAIYKMLPPGNKHLLVLKGADHMTFAGESVEGIAYSRAPGVTLASDQPQWRKVSAMTALFWQRYLFAQPANATATLEKQALRELHGSDRWESK